MTTFDYSRLAPVIPVVTIEESETALQLAQTLINGGLGAIEIVLRTPAAWPAINAIRKEFPDVLLGVGTLVVPKQVEMAVDSGADFLISPGSSPALCEALRNSGLPALPGVSTLSEALSAWEAGFSHQKFFPAEFLGGHKILSAWKSLLPKIGFCPTGGISARTAPSYLELSNVFAVGGSWLVPQPLLREKNWSAVEKLAKEASSLLKKG